MWKATYFVLVALVGLGYAAGRYVRSGVWAYSAPVVIGAGFAALVAFVFDRTIEEEGFNADPRNGELALYTGLAAFLGYVCACAGVYWGRRAGTREDASA